MKGFVVRPTQRQSWPGSVKIRAGPEASSTNRDRLTRRSNLWRIWRDGTPLLATSSPSLLPQSGRDAKRNCAISGSSPTSPPMSFADEVAQFYKLPRLDLPQLLAASSLAGQFSHRFLREMAVFPCQLEEGGAQHFGRRRSHRRSQRACCRALPRQSGRACRCVV